MPVKNFKIANAKNLTMELKKKTTTLRYIYSLRFYSLTSTQRYKRDFVEKKEETRAIKLKIQEKHMTLTSLLMFSPELNLERELCNTSVLSPHI